MGRGEMVIGLALCVVLLAFYAWLVDRRPDAWSNGWVFGRARNFSRVCRCGEL